MKDKDVKKKKEFKYMKKCTNCNSEMKPRGAADTCGSRSWKCRNKKCGRTLWEKTYPRPPVPLVYVKKWR